MNAAKAARREALEEPRQIEFGDPPQQFNLPEELPFEVAEAMAAADIRGTIAHLLNGQADAFWALQPTVPDLESLIQWISEEYAGVGLGESSASSSPSDEDGETTRQLSEATTD